MTQPSWFKKLGFPVNNFLENPTSYNASIKETVSGLIRNSKNVLDGQLILLGYRFIKWTSLVVLLIHWVSVENFQLRTFKGIFDCVERPGIKITVCRFWLHVYFIFWSTFCPNTDSPFILLYVKGVFSGYKSLSLKIKANS